MRLWSVHPKYLDTRGLVALWREGLLALHVLRGQTKGYTRHPQLLRFKNHPQPVEALTAYLHEVVDEAELRNYSFNRQKLGKRLAVEKIPVTNGQVCFETDHLKKKLCVRDQDKFEICKAILELDPHPLFIVIPGEIEKWERV